jgi:uncharacterized protein YxjI
MQQPLPGWQRFVMKSRMGAGRDFAVTDLDGAQVYIVDGKMGLRPKADVKDRKGDVRYSVRGHMLGLPKQMTVTDHEGNEVASLKAKFFSPIRSKMTLTMTDGTSWHVEGSLLEKDYSVTRAGQPIVQISQKWIAIRDSYTLDVVDGVDPALALAIVWTIDRWVENED